VADRKSLERMGVQTQERLNVGTFAEGQRRYLDWHQEYVFLESQLSRDT
jgi:putative restriction endonuclease